MLQSLVLLSQLHVRNVMGVSYEQQITYLLAH